jgi:hypothetical protein
LYWSRLISYLIKIIYSYSRMKKEYMLGNKIIYQKLHKK